MDSSNLLFSSHINHCGLVVKALGSGARPDHSVMSLGMKFTTYFLLVDLVSVTVTRYGLGKVPASVHFGQQQNLSSRVQCKNTKVT